MAAGTHHYPQKPTSGGSDGRTTLVVGGSLTTNGLPLFNLFAPMSVRGTEPL